MTDEQVKAELDDWMALAITLWAEGRGEPVEGQIAIGCVIRNRVAHPRRFGSTYRAVCLQRGQFSCWFQAGGAANYQRTLALARSFAEGTDVPLKGDDASIFAQCAYLAEGIIGQQLRTNVRTSTHYYAPAAMQPKGRVPEWAKGKAPAAKVGGHLFFEGIA